MRTFETWIENGFDRLASRGKGGDEEKGREAANILLLFCGRGQGEVRRIETCSHVKLRQLDVKCVRELNLTLAEASRWAVSSW